MGLFGLIGIAVQALIVAALVKYVFSDEVVDQRSRAVVWAIRANNLGGGGRTR